MGRLRGINTIAQVKHGRYVKDAERYKSLFTPLQDARSAVLSALCEEGKRFDGGKNVDELAKDTGYCKAQVDRALVLLRQLGQVYSHRVPADYRSDGRNPHCLLWWRS